MASYLLRRAASYAPAEVWKNYKTLLKAGSAITAYYYTSNGKKVYTNRVPRGSNRTRVNGNRTRTKGRRTGRTRTTGYYGRYRGADKERKFHDGDMDVTITSSGLFTQLNLIPQGDTEKTHVGRKAFIKQIMIRGEILLPVTSDPGNSSNVVRMIVFVDKQCNGVAATALQLLETNDYQSFRNLVNSGRFTVLKDRTFMLNATSGAYDGTNDNYGEKEHPFFFSHDCNIPIQWDAATGAITEIPTNNISVMWIAKSSVNVLVKSKFRLRFTD